MDRRRGRFQFQRSLGRFKTGLLSVAARVAHEARFIGLELDFLFRFLLRKVLRANIG
jgi:hypothetical protein